MKKVCSTCWNTRWAISIALTVTVTLGLGACRSSPTKVYTIDAVTPRTHIEVYAGPPLRIDSLNVPAGWDRIEILSASGTGALEIRDFDHWSAPLAQIARQTLSDDLDRRLPAGSVIYPRLPKASGALGVSVDILGFDMAGSQATMRSSWFMIPAEGMTNAKRSVASLHTSLSSTSPLAVAQAWADLLGQLADRIASDAASFAPQ